jgi:hypothetical protein
VDEALWVAVAGRASVWVIDTNLADGISRVEPATNRITRLLPSKGVTLGGSAVVAARPRPPR